MSAHREANRPYPKRPTGRERSRRRLVRAPGRLRVPPPRTYRPTTSPIRRYRPIRRCTRRRSGLHRSRRRLHRCGRTDGDASPPPDEGGNHLMSDSLDEGCHSKRRIPSTTSCSSVTRGHQRSSEVISGHQRSLEVNRGHQRSSEVIGGHQRQSEVIRGHQSTSSCSSVIGCASSAGLCLPPGTAPGLLLLLLPPPTPTPDTALETAPETAPLPPKPNQLPPPPGTALDESRGWRVERGEGESARDVISANACRERGDDHEKRCDLAEWGDYHHAIVIRCTRRHSEALRRHSEALRGTRRHYKRQSRGN